MSGWLEGETGGPGVDVQFRSGILLGGAILKTMSFSLVSELDLQWAINAALE
jgi:hypothetical protein